MAILSTNQKLIKVDVGYSAGNGIDITSGVISVTGDNAPYSAGQNIYFDGDDNHVINGKDWGNEINDASANAFNTASAWVAQNYANSADLTYLSGVVDNKLDTSAWSSVSADMATEQYVIANGNIVFGRTTAWVNDQNYSTVSQLESVSSDLNTNKLDASSYHELTAGDNIDIQNYIISSKDWTNDIQNASSNAYNESTGYVNNWIEETYSTDKSSLSAAIDYVSANAGDQEVNDVVHTYSANGTWLVANDITGLQEKGDYYSASNPSGFLVPNDISNLATISLVEETSGSIVNLIPDTSNFITNVSAESTYQTIDGMTAYQPVGDYATNTQVNELSGAIDYVSANAGDQEVHNIVHTNSATWDSVTNKLDTTAFSTVSSDFLVVSSLNGYATESLVQDTSANITALIPDTSNFITNTSAESTYQTIEGMTAYQPVGDYATTADLALKQDTLTFGYDEQDRINSINSSALAGGGDVPEDVMVESAIGYNAVNEISGYNGSAIAQYGAEKQWLVHDDTLVHASNSAQYALGVNVSALQRLMGIDETVLFEGTATSASWPITLSESTNNFETFKIEWCPYTETSNWETPYDVVNTKLNNGTIHLFGQGLDKSGTYAMMSNLLISANGDKLTKKQFISMTMYNSNINVGNLERYKIYKIIGIGRKEI